MYLRFFNKAPSLLFRPESSGADAAKNLVGDDESPSFYVCNSPQDEVQAAAAWALTFPKKPVSATSPLGIYGLRFRAEFLTAGGAFTQDGQGETGIAPVDARHATITQPGADGTAAAFQAFLVSLAGGEDLVRPFGLSQVRSHWAAFAEMADVPPDTKRRAREWTA